MNTSAETSCRRSVPLMNATMRGASTDGDHEGGCIGGSSWVDQSVQRDPAAPAAGLSSLGPVGTLGKTLARLRLQFTRAPLPAAPPDPSSGGPDKTGPAV